VRTSLVSSHARRRTLLRCRAGTCAGARARAGGVEAASGGAGCRVRRARGRKKGAPCARKRLRKRAAALQLPTAHAAALPAPTWHTQHVHTHTHTNTARCQWCRRARRQAGERKRASERTAHDHAGRLREERPAQLAAHQRPAGAVLRRRLHAAQPRQAALGHGDARAAPRRNAPPAFARTPRRRGAADAAPPRRTRACGRPAARCWRSRVHTARRAGAGARREGMSVPARSLNSR
jgi:hypothetical protein